MKFFRDLLLAVLACIAAILALEGGLRLAHERYNAYLYQPEPERGYSLRPYAEGWNVTGGENYVRINSDGMRDHERPAHRPADTMRIAVLGASFAEAREVPLEQTFAAEMERQLAQALGPHGSRVDVLNFGVNGYTHSEQYLTLHNHVWKYDPQIVVMLWDQFTVIKNTRENYPEELGRDRVPFYALRNGRLEPLEPPPALRSLRYPSPRRIALKNLMSDAMNSSYLLSMFNQAREQLPGQIGNVRAMVRRVFVGPPPVAARPQDNRIEWWPLAPYLAETQRDWAIGEAFLREIRDECDRHGVEFRLVIVDGDVQSSPDVAARNAFARRYGLVSLDKSDLRVERYCQANGIRVLRLGPPMGDYAATHRVALHSSNGWNAWGHWNKPGNRLAGRLIAEDLRNDSPVVRAWGGGYQ